MKDLVVGIDSSTQSTKAIAWDREGRLIAEGRSPIPYQNPQLYWYEQKCEDWWTSCVKALENLTNQIDAQRIAGVSISNQRETVGFLDEQGKSVRPGIVWLDERSRPQVEDLAARVGADVIHDITGRPVDITPVLYRVAWLRDNEPELYSKTACFIDVQGYLVYRLSGKLNTGWFSADPMGYFDIREKIYSPLLLEELGLSVDRFPQAFAPGTCIGEVTAGAAGETGLAVGTGIFAGGGDGQCAALGTNCIVPGKAYINLGTAVVSGVWSKECLNSKAWRTEIDGTGEGYNLETCLRSGAFLVNWFVDQFLPGDRSQKDFFKKLESQASQIPVGSDGLITLPFWSGVMNPYWNPKSRGCVIGLSGNHSPVHMYRSILEGMCLYQSQATSFVEEETGVPIDKYIAIGGGASSPLWTQMLADASGREVSISDTIEASALGAAMIAACGAGWFASVRDAAAEMQGKTHAITPDPGIRQTWDELIDIYSGIHQDNESTFNRLVDFTEKRIPNSA